jgi:hypothetical protein
VGLRKVLVEVDRDSGLYGEKRLGLGGEREGVPCWDGSTFVGSYITVYGLIFARSDSAEGSIALQSLFYNLNPLSDLGMCRIVRLQGFVEHDGRYCVGIRRHCLQLER